MLKRIIKYVVSLTTIFMMLVSVAAPLQAEEDLFHIDNGNNGYSYYLTEMEYEMFGEELEDVNVIFTKIGDKYYVTNPDVLQAILDGNNNARDKYIAPTIDISALDDNTNQYKNETVESWLGDTIKFKVNLTVGQGAAGYKIEIPINDGFILDDNSVNLTKGNNENVVTSYTKEIITNQETKLKTITITFNQCSDLNNGDVYSVSYIVRNNYKGCMNIEWSAILKYGENSQYSSLSKMTIKMKPYVITHTLNGQAISTENLSKVAGLKYELYESRNTITRSTSLNKLKVRPLTTEEKTALGLGVGTYYIVDETQDNTEIVIPKYPDIYIFGLTKNGSYKLKQTAAPEGYGVINDYISISSTGENVIDISKSNSTVLDIPMVLATGGSGTTIFYVVGSILILVAGILLKIRKRIE